MSSFTEFSSFIQLWHFLGFLLMPPYRFFFFRTEAESNNPEIDTLSCTELRDKLALDPLDK
jgi:hypothetical protein